jgi:hypothetical protein
MIPNPRTPVDRLLTISLVLAPAVTLISSLLFAARGWDDGTAGAIQVVAGVLDMLLVMVLVTHLHDRPRLAAVALGLGALGAGGWVAYGINTIETSYGNVDLVDLTGAATIIKPLGLCWPAMLVLVGATFLRSRRVPLPCGLGIVLAGALLPVSRIGNIWQLAIVVDVLLLASLVPIAWMQLKGTPRDQAGPVQSPATA